MSVNFCVTLPCDNQEQISVRIATYADACTQTEVRRRQTVLNHSTPRPIVWGAQRNPNPNQNSNSNPRGWGSSVCGATVWGSRTQNQSNQSQDQNQNQDDNPWAPKPKRKLVRDTMYSPISPSTYFQELEEEDSLIEQLIKQSIEYFY